MDEPRDYQIKLNKSERERQISYDITYMWNLKYGTNELIYETDPETQRTDLCLPRDMEDKGELYWEFRTGGWKLLCMEWMNKVLQFSTGSYIQYPVIIHNEKQNEKNIYRFYIYLIYNVMVIVCYTAKQLRYTYTHIYVYI